MNKPFFRSTMAVAISVLGLVACAPTTPRLDSQFGASTRTTLAQQIIDPAAASKNVPESVEGAVARESVERYRNSYRETSAAGDAFAIGLGSSRSR